MSKAPAFQFYPNDWSRDLEEHPLEIEGAWIRLCCKLWWAEPRGTLTRTLTQWARILRTSEEDANRIIWYIKEQQIGDVQRNGNGDVTVISRRMIRDEKLREQNKLRVQRFREKQSCNDDVTHHVTQLSHCSSSSSSNTPIVPKGDDDGLFEIFWKNYPKKIGKQAARKAWNKIRSPKEVLEKMKAVLPRQKVSEQWTKDNGQFIPHPATYLNQGRWEDETII
jgi:hypothetical protein